MHNPSKMIGKVSDTLTFIKKASIIHNFKYDYSEVKYVKSSIKVKIICPTHGIFEQRPNDHIQGQECPFCGEIKSRISKNQNCIDKKKKFSFAKNLPVDCKAIYLNSKYYTIVDSEDYEELIKHNWIYRNGYAKKDLGLHKSMHRMILKIVDNKIQADHINGDRLDNRKLNLRTCSNNQNQLNKPVRLFKKSSRFKGVCKGRKSKNYNASICFNRTTHYLGSFKTEEEAARAYDAKAKELHKEFAYYNFPKEKINV